MCYEPILNNVFVVVMGSSIRESTLHTTTQNKNINNKNPTAYKI
jgi:hypothetical protein